MVSQYQNQIAQRDDGSEAMSRAHSTPQHAMITTWAVTTLWAMTGALAFGASKQPAKAMDYGPFLSNTITVPNSPANNIAFKGIAVKLGGGQGGMCFDTDLLRWQAGWTGGYLNLTGISFDGRHGVPGPTVAGRQIFTTMPEPGFAGPNQGFKNPRASIYGPLPATWGRWKGLYKHGDKVILNYQIQHCLLAGRA